MAIAPERQTTRNVSALHFDFAQAVWVGGERVGGEHDEVGALASLDTPRLAFYSEHSGRSRRVAAQRLLYAGASSGSSEAAVRVRRVAALCTAEITS